VTHLDAALGACQLGITIASLGLGWLGEPAIARRIGPVLESTGVGSPQVIHGAAFVIAFSAITAGHLVIGELAPKAFAIRKPELMARWCAPPLKAFYLLFFPVLVVLNGAALVLVRWLGISDADGLSDQHSEAELRALLSHAHVEGELSRTEHQLLDAVFEFEDLVCRRVMVPRGDVDFLDVDMSIPECIEIINRTKHTRYPVCKGSLDAVVGVVHIKDLLGLDESESQGLRNSMRPPHHVPETMSVSRLLRYFQAVHQHIAFVVDEYGTIIGIVTMENILELIVGRVEDEFDTETPDIVPAGSREFLVQGRTPVEAVKDRFRLKLEGDADTLSGLLVEKIGHILEVGDTVELGGAMAEVVEVKGARARLVRLTLDQSVADKVESEREPLES
jgi:CBS domain containing-hemolysin-like protein